MAVPNFLLWVSAVALQLTTVDILSSFVTSSNTILQKQSDIYDISDQVILVLTNIACLKPLRSCYEIVIIKESSIKRPNQLDVPYSWVVVI